MVGRTIAGAARLPFFPHCSYLGADQPKVNPRIRLVESPYGDDPVAVLPPLNAGVTIIHAQRADAGGNTQIRGQLGAQKEVAFAAERVIAVVKETEEEKDVRNDPNRTAMPGLVVDAEVHLAFGAHPSYARSCYDRDNEFYLEWDRISRRDHHTDPVGGVGPGRGGPGRLSCEARGAGAQDLATAGAS